MERNQIYKCSVCGHIIEILHSSDGKLVCCDKPMELQRANTVDASIEKHVPVITQKKDKVIIKVGSEPHPMVENHYIEWIELITSYSIQRIYLTPNSPPMAEFEINPNYPSEKIVPYYARAYCNLHGLWQSNRGDIIS